MGDWGYVFLFVANRLVLFQVTYVDLHPLLAQLKICEGPYELLKFSDLLFQVSFQK